MATPSSIAAASQTALPVPPSLQVRRPTFSTYSAPIPPPPLSSTTVTMSKSIVEDGEIIEHNQLPEVIEISSGSDDSPRQTTVIDVDAPLPIPNPPVQHPNSHFPPSSSHRFSSPSPLSVPYSTFNCEPWQPNPTFADPVLGFSPTHDHSRYGQQRMAPSAQQWGSRLERGLGSSFAGRGAFNNLNDVLGKSFHDEEEYIPPSVEAGEPYSQAMPYHSHGMHPSPNINVTHQMLYREPVGPHVNYMRGWRGVGNEFAQKEDTDAMAGIRGNHSGGYGDVLSSRGMAISTGYSPAGNQNAPSQGFETRTPRQPSLFEMFPPGNVVGEGVLPGPNSFREGPRTGMKPSPLMPGDMHPPSSVFTSRDIVTSPILVPDEASPSPIRSKSDGKRRDILYPRQSGFQSAMPAMLDRVGQKARTLIDGASIVVGNHDDGGPSDTIQFGHSEEDRSLMTPVTPYEQENSPCAKESSKIHNSAHGNGRSVRGWARNMLGNGNNVDVPHHTSPRSASFVYFEQIPDGSLPVSDISIGNSKPMSSMMCKAQGICHNPLALQKLEMETPFLSAQDIEMDSSDQLAQTEGTTKQKTEPQATHRKLSKPSLLELRKKVLLSMRQRSDKEIQDEKECHDKLSSKAIKMKSEFIQGKKLEATEKSEVWPLQSFLTGQQHTRLIVELSDSESEEESVTMSDTTEDVAGKGKTSSVEDRQPPPKVPREKIIEGMKIRMVQIGRCPSSLETKKRCRSSSPVTNASTILDTRGQSQPSVKRETILNESDHQSEANGVQTNAEIVMSPTDVALRPINSEKTENSSAGLAKSSVPKLERAVNPPTGTESELPTNEQEETHAGETAESAKARSEDISLLKKQIAALEARNARKRKFATMDCTDPNYLESPLRTGNSLAVSNIDATNGTSFQVNIVSEQPRHSSDSARHARKEKTFYLDLPSKRRYYSEEASRKDAEKRRGSPKREPTNSPKPLQQDQSTSEKLEELGAWNQRQLMETNSAVLPDRANAGLVDDLKSELETQKRQIANIQDYSKLVLASDVSLAQAAAKLSFKRNRVSGLEQELKRAKFDVIDAEQDYDKIASAAKRMRATLDGLGFSDMFPPPDISTANSEGKSADDAAITNCRNGNEHSQSDTDSCEKTDVESDVSKADEEDPILQQSPYSPSVGDTFLSCLSGLQAFIVRIPHHRKAADRKLMSPLSLTWTHNLDPMKTICPRELYKSFSCVDKKCEHEHLRNFQARTGHALDVVDRVQAFVDNTVATEKQIVRAKIDLYSGKDVDDTVSTLISSLCPIPSKTPFSRSHEKFLHTLGGY